MGLYRSQPPPTRPRVPDLQRRQIAAPPTPPRHVALQDELFRLEQDRANLTPAQVNRVFTISSELGQLGQVQRGVPLPAQYRAGSEDFTGRRQQLLDRLAALQGLNRSDRPAPQRLGEYQDRVLNRVQEVQQIGEQFRALALERRGADQRTTVQQLRDRFEELEALQRSDTAAPGRQSDLESRNMSRMNEVMKVTSDLRRLGVQL